MIPDLCSYTVVMASYSNKLLISYDIIMELKVPSKFMNYQEAGRTLKSCAKSRKYLSFLQDMAGLGG